jgi:nicotinic acid mononucleotide adenylyltransferase
MNYDKYYQNLFNINPSVDLLIKSGWINEGNWDGELHLEQLTTPLSNIIRNSDNITDVSVLLYPGCFAPIHEGHLEAMKIAKRTVEEQTGETVVAGYFVPDSDDYVQRKTGDIRFDGPHRVQIAQAVTADSSWMDVDSWSALHATQSLNFTTLYDRFIAYVEKWLPHLNVKVYLVFGEDNILFANAFLAHGHAVCVLRTESDPDTSLLLTDVENRTLYSTETPPVVSSSAVRKQKIRALPQVTEVLGRNVLGTDYVLRDDLELALQGTILENRTKQISTTLFSILEASIPEDVVLKRVNVREQLHNYVTDEKTISLDVFWHGDYDLQVSRLFDVSNHQIGSRKYINRPGSVSLEEQLDSIADGSYMLVDDDIASGTTMTTIETLLNSKGIGVHQKDSLLQNEDGSLFDVVDARDFIIGATHGGLVVRTPLGITRAPYVFPFVNLTTRAKLDAKVAMAFSQKIWKLNLELYRGTGVTVADIKAQDFTLLGFSPEKTIQEICETFIK